jgi:anti-sigma regulatory factor (Ser/Thr protein kinase)
LFKHRPRQLSFTLRNRRSEIARMFSLVERFCRINRIGGDDLFNLRLVLDEAVINIIVHGYEDEAEHHINVSLALEGSTIAIDIDDDGMPYNPLDAPPPQFDRPIEERRIGGLGVHIIKSLARSVEYRREEGRNHLAIVMKLGAADAAART